MAALEVPESTVYGIEPSDNEPEALDLAADYVNKVSESAHDAFEKESNLA